MRASLVAICVTATFAGCAGSGPPEATTTRVSGLTQSVPLAADTFINSAYPDNNNGRSDSIYTGRNGMSGFMRGLVQFTLPAALQGRVTVTGARLAMTTRGLSMTGTAPPTAATESLQALSVAWTQGDGVGNAMTMNTVGDPCGTTGATWNQPSCAGGVAWSGGSVASSVSGQASVPAAIDVVVAWDSTTAGNAGMIADVQSWIDTPANNHGWRIVSNTEPTTGQAQRFYSSEAGTGAPPALTITYGCKAGLLELGTGCTTCTAAATAACTAGQPGNACNDPGAPATSYTCTCGNAAYVGTGSVGCTDRNECTTNHCHDSGDAAASCTDAVAPATGYSCTCSSGFVFNGTTCIANALPDGGSLDGATDGSDSGGGGGAMGGTGGAGGTSGAGGAGGAAGGGAAGSGGAAGAAGATGGTAGAAGGTAGGSAGGAGGAAGAGAAAGTGGAGGATAGAGGRGGGAGTTGNAGAGGAAGRGGSGTAGGGAGTGTNGGGGCSCSLAVRNDPGAAVLLAIAAVISMMRRRRSPS